MITIKNTNGLTILEVLVAMIILSMSLLLLLNMGMVALDGNDWSNNTTVATQQLQDKLEELRTIPNLSSAHSGADTVSGMERSWRVSWEDNHLRRVDVSIVWENIQGKEMTNTMTGFIKTDSI